MTTQILPKNSLFNKNSNMHKSMSSKMSGLVVPGFNRTIPKYAPAVSPDVTLYECLECGDKFALKSSYEMHINRHGATIEHVCKICRQPNAFRNTCQLLAHARRHKNFSQQINQENLNDVVVVPATQQDLYERNSFKAFDSDICETRDAFLNGAVAKLTTIDGGCIKTTTSLLASVLQQQQQQNGGAGGSSSTEVNFAADGQQSMSGNSNQLGNPAAGLLILNTNQNVVPGLINPFSNHNLILTESGIVAVPNLQANLGGFPIQPAQITTSTAATSAAQQQQQQPTNSTSTTTGETQNTATPITTTSSASNEYGNTSTSSATSNAAGAGGKSLLKTQQNNQQKSTTTETVIKTEPSPEGKKPTVFLKDIGTLLKNNNGNNTNSSGGTTSNSTSTNNNSNNNNGKNLPNPVVAWGSNGDRMCVECNTQVKQSLTLREHYMTLRGSKTVPTCTTCGIQLPSKCALSCHMRLHTRLPPFICPDCVIRFSSFAQLTEHMNKVCYHLDKRARQKCPLENCTTKLFPNPNSFMKHLAVQHMKSIFKCNLCPIACYTQVSLNQHMSDKHYGCPETPSPYYQCSLCPDRLIPKSRLDQHIEEHAQGCTVMNVYLCRQCNKFNLMRNDHVAHIAKCKGGGSSAGSVVQQQQNSNSNRAANKRALDGSGSGEQQDAVKKSRLDTPPIVDGGVKSKPDVKKPTDLPVIEKLSANKPLPITNGDCLLQKTVITNCYDCKRELSCTFTGENEKSLPIRCPQCYKSSKHIAKLPCPGLVKIDLKTHKKEGVVVATTTSSASVGDRKSLIKLPASSSSVTASSSPVGNKDSVTSEMEDKKPSIKDIVLQNDRVTNIIRIGEKSKSFSDLSVIKLDKNAGSGGGVSSGPNSGGDSVSKKMERKSCDDRVVTKIVAKATPPRRTTPEKKKPANNKINDDNVDDEAKTTTTTKVADKEKSAAISEETEGDDGSVSNANADVAVVINSNNRRSPKGKRGSTDSSSTTTSTTAGDDKTKQKKANPQETTSDDVTAKSPDQDQDVTMEEEEVAANNNKSICGICNYVTEDTAQFRAHIVTHRDVNTAYQCMECGLSFMVKPTLQKHLLIRHATDDVDRYIAENRECVDKEAVRAVLQTIIVGRTTEDVKENQCRICREQFETGADHDKHFRVHGMAFLKQKELDKITSET